MAVYLTDSHHRAGYLVADTKGKVTDVYPADD
jgi:hypothetical protein